MSVLETPMKALTLTQPWASLMALREKRIETRSWATSYRGPLAIHAAKGFPRWAKDMVELPLFSRALEDRTVKDLPRSRVLCVVELLGCFRTEELHKVAFVLGEPISKKELAFGDYSHGRYAWVTRFVEPVDDDGPTTGSLGLWDWLRGPKTEATKQEIAMRAYDRGETTL